MAAPKSKRGAKRVSAKKKSGGRAMPPKRRAAKPGASARRTVRRPAHRTAKRPARRTRAPGATTSRPASSAVPNDIGLASQHLDYSSHHLEEVKRFYTEVLGFRQFVHDPQMNYLMVTTGPGSSLGFMPPMEGPPEEWRPPREPQLYLFVEDVDAAHAMLVRRGVEFLQPPTDMPWMHRVARLRDPEGRMVCLATPTKKEG